ncbi:hypothetical protein L1987_46367 [Smallanthus sonchifolius]|uniref:Uncharacterized protein n=1 Tax=Smallanthus sonchifolius TaxID=185202 RepID=A0ACB9G0I4_9ASTR|nr:hypothetical protein L1987_46367 [Smallanthus sonchifolius]
MERLRGIQFLLRTQRVHGHGYRSIVSFKTLLHISSEDVAFIAFNREMDANSFQNEREGSKRHCFLMAGKKLKDWLAESDAIAKEVEFELISRDIGCHLTEVLGAVNKVLFGSMCFKRSNIMDSKCSYLHSVLSSKCGSGNPEELFNVNSGHNLFGIVNGLCVDNPMSKASYVNSSLPLGLDIATNRDIIGLFVLQT